MNPSSPMPSGTPGIGFADNLLNATEKRPFTVFAVGAAISIIVLGPWCVPFSYLLAFSVFGFVMSREERSKAEKHSGSAINQRSTEI